MKDVKYAVLLVALKLEGPLKTENHWWEAPQPLPGCPAGFMRVPGHDGHTGTLTQSPDFRFLSF